MERRLFFRENKNNFNYGFILPATLSAKNDEGCFRVLNGSEKFCSLILPLIMMLNETFVKG